MPEKTDKAASPKPDPVAVIAEALKAAGYDAHVTATRTTFDTAFVAIINNGAL